MGTTHGWLRESPTAAVEKTPLMANEHKNRLARRQFYKPGGEISG